MCVATISWAKKNVTVIYLHSSEVTFPTDKTNESFSFPPCWCHHPAGRKNNVLLFLASVSYSMSSKCLAELFGQARNLAKQGNRVSLKPRICDRASLSQNSRCSVCVDLLRALEVFLNQLTQIQCPPILSRWWWSQADKMVEITPAQQMFRCSWSDPDG